MKKNNKLIGKVGEIIAASYLMEKGYNIIKKNFLSKFGEIDIICEKKDCYYFFEVKTRLNDEHIKPFESVDNRKIRKILNTMYFFLQKHGKLSFDKDKKLKIISLTLNENLYAAVSLIKDLNEIDYENILEGEDYKIEILDVYI
jgi:putative endonuclease